MDTLPIDRRYLLLAFGLSIIFFLPSIVVSGETMVVGDGSGDYGSIPEAVHVAEPGDTVLLSEDHYTVNLEIDKNITLKGKGSEMKVLSGNEAGRPVLTVGPSAVEVTLINLELGNAKGELCQDRVKGICPTGLTLHGKASAEVSGSSFKSNGLNGIRLVGNSELKLADSTIVGSERSGLKVVDSAEATVIEGKISNNRTGVTLTKSGRASFSDVELIKNSRYGFFLFGDSRLELEGSRVVNNGKGGLRFENSPRVEVSRTDVINNEGRGIRIEGKSRVTLINNRITGNQVGVSNHGDLPVEFASNNISKNGVDLVGDLSGDLRTELNDRQVEEITLPDENYPGLQAAIDALEPGGHLYVKGKVVGSAVVDKDITIESLGGSGQLTSPEGVAGPVLSLINGARSEIRDLTLKNPDGSGLVLGGNASLRVFNSNLSGSSGAGLELYDSTTLTLDGSEVNNNGGSGVRVVDSASVLMKDSHLTGNGTDNLLLAGDSSALVRGSELSDGKGAGAGIYDSADLTAADSKFSGNRGNGIKVTSSARAGLESCELKGNGEAGTTLYTASQLDISGSEVHGNVTGTSLADSASASFDNNSFTGNQTGIKVGKPEEFAGDIRGSGNEFSGNGTDFAGVIESIRDELTG